ncbi:11348_t:CDS:2 [Funneliformis mosseae]|uniref:11348_t:CDS:1 n=1 Tax=Funneliformis mosseae TaxID=27381 RepID=A0A9N9A2J2_FUNMO|nr:11348_t:CDS:2 [Funneliformis mosseae]
MSNDFATEEYLAYLEFLKIITQLSANYREYLVFLNRLRRHNQEPPISYDLLLGFLFKHIPANNITLETFREILTYQIQCNQAPPSQFGGISQPSQNHLELSNSLGEIPQQGQYYPALLSSLEYPQQYQESTFYSQGISEGRPNEPDVESLVSSQIHNTAALVNHNDQPFTFENENNHQAFDSQNEKCKWEDEPTKVLLFYLTEKKEDVMLDGRSHLDHKDRLWNGAVIALSNKGYTYTAIQCVRKWKNMKQNYKLRFQIPMDLFNTSSNMTVYSKRKLEHELVNGPNKARKLENR